MYAGLDLIKFNPSSWTSVITKVSNKSSEPRHKGLNADNNKKNKSRAHCERQMVVRGPAPDLNCPIDAKVRLGAEYHLGMATTRMVHSNDMLIRIIQEARSHGTWQRDRNVIMVDKNKSRKWKRGMAERRRRRRRQRESQLYLTVFDVQDRRCLVGASW